MTGFAGCASCDHGWREVAPGYIERMFPYPGNATDVQRAAVDRERDVYSVFLFPCAECRPTAFERWRNGCMSRGHVAGRCDLCVAEMGVKEATSRDRSAY